MQNAFLIILNLIFGGLLLGLGAVSLRLHKKVKEKEQDTEKQKEESTRRLYEIAILREIGEKTGYSLDVEEILRIIAGSLHQFIEYSAVSYVVIKDEKLRLNTYLEASVDKTFISEMKNRMASSLSALLDKTIDPEGIEEQIGGAIALDDLPQKIGSFFNIPIVISGKLSGLLTIAHIKVGLYKEEDMTILYKITAQAASAVTRLEEVVRTEEAKILKVREEYTSMIVHELRSPLDGMRKIVEFIISDSIEKDEKQFKEYMGMVHQSATSMLELVNDILDFSKLQAGKFEINKEKSSVKDAVENRIAFYKILAGTKNIALSSFIDKSVPDVSLFDPYAIKQVINNFISNALKFTPASGAIEIISFLFTPGEDISGEASEEIDKMKVKLLKEDIKIGKKSVVIAVFDSGLGIRGEKQKDLFVVYKQAGPSPLDPESKGTGLGLVIAKGIIGAHEGFISVKSEENMGSVFFFAIPIE